jgi:hypothetical protein
MLAGSSTQTLAYGADPALTADFSNPGGAVLAANQLLAELAMIQLETPGLTRGVAVLPPPGWNADPTFIDTLLAGLYGHPLLNPVTASQLFRAVPLPAAALQRSVEVPQPSVPVSPGSAAGVAGAGGQGSPSSTATPATTATTATTLAPALVADAAAQLGADASTIHDARQRLSGLGAILPLAARQAAALGQELLTAESSDITEAQRESLLGLVFMASDRVTKLITLPAASSITLTSTRGEVPLTVLSAPSLRARVELRLSSQRLIFHQAFAPNGKCQVPTPTSEVCDLTLTTENTTIKVPVETRSSGVFPLDVSLWTPDGSEMLVRDRDTVRSTAVSGVGIILIALAAASLAIWWARDLRHGRRARRLVPAPGEAGAGEDAGRGRVGPRGPDGPGGTDRPRGPDGPGGTDRPRGPGGSRGTGNRLAGVTGPADPDDSGNRLAGVTGPADLGDSGPGVRAPADPGAPVPGVIASPTSKYQGRSSQPHA